MSKAKQLTEFMSENKIRLIFNELLSPIIKNVQHELQKNKKQFSSMQKIIEEFSQQDISNYISTIKQSNNKILELKQQITSIRNSLSKSQLANLNNFQNIKNQIYKLTKQSNKKLQVFKENIDKADLASKKIQKLQQSTELSLGLIRSKLNQNHKENMQEIRKSINLQKQSYEALQIARKQIEKQRINYHQSSDIISLYVSQKNQINIKLNDILNQIMNYVTNERFNALQFRLQQKIENKGKMIQNTQQIIKNLPQKDTLDQLKSIIHDIETKVKHFNKINSLQIDILQIREQLNLKKVQTNNQYENIQLYIKKVQQKIQSVKIKDAEENIQIQKQSLQKLKEQFHHQVECIRQQMSGKVPIKLLQTTLENIARQTPIRQLKLKDNLANEVSQKTDLINKRCIFIESIANSLQEQLFTFHNKITRIKSDNELFQSYLKNKYHEIQKNQIQTSNKLQQIAKILNSILQVLSISCSINIYDSILTAKQKIVYVTYNDGILCQIENNSNGQLSFHYRRKLVDSQELKQSLMTGITSLIDASIRSLEFINKQDYKPSQFFQTYIYENYKILQQKNQPKKQNKFRKSYHKQGNKKSKINLSFQKQKQKQGIKATVNNIRTARNSLKKNFTNDKDFKKITKITTNNQQLIQPLQLRVTTARSGRYGKLNAFNDI